MCLSRCFSPVYTPCEAQGSSYRDYIDETTLMISKSREMIESKTLQRMVSCGTNLSIMFSALNLIYGFLGISHTLDANISDAQTENYRNKHS